MYSMRWGVQTNRGCTGLVLELLVDYAEERFLITLDTVKCVCKEDIDI